jgi:hypothetical protein
MSAAVTSTVTLLAQAEGDLLAVVQLEYHPFEVQQDVDDVFLHTVNGRVLVQDTPAIVTSVAA